MADSTTLSASLTTDDEARSTGVLAAIADYLVELELVRADTWQTDMQRRGELVHLYRDYYDGDHRMKLNTEMKKMLNISGELTDQMNANYCGLVVDAIADRLDVAAVEADGDDAKNWALEVRQRNRFDGLQINVHDAALIDADTYVMVAYDSDEANGGANQGVVLAHEPAWDGDTGMLVVYDRKRENIVAAVKVWWETDTAQRVNFYFPDRIEKYRFDDDKLVAIETEKWVDQRTGEALGVPVVPFYHQRRNRTTQGISALASTIPLQDGLNSTYQSMVMTALLTAFAMWKAKGFKPDASVAPGKIIYFGDDITSAEMAGLLSAMDFDKIEQGEITPFIEQAGWIIEQIGTITRTPLPGAMGSDNASGESLKQREIGLIGKITKFQVQNGNAWEDVFALAARLQAAWGTTAGPVDARWTCKWQSAEIRNWTEIEAKANMLYDWGFEEEALRVLGYEADKITELLMEKGQRSARKLTDVLRNTPGYEQFLNGNAA